MTNFVNFHVLISHSPACLNRDDMNMQKDAVFGGKRRVRISSQSLKRAIRKSDYYASHIGEPSIRTINLSALREQLQKALEGKHSPELIDQTIRILSGRPDADFSQDEKITGDAVTPWVVGEVDWFCTQIAQGNTDGLDEKKLIKSLKTDLEALHSNLQKGVDVALSGRMATSGLMSEVGKVDGAMSIAHAITTHTVDSDLDWFTAVDDLQELGSAHLGTQEFSAGVFYRYASLNLSKLQENLGGVSRAEALEIAAHLAHMLATETPNAKQRTFAAFNPADLVMVNFSDVPVSLANAFESPVKARQEGYLKPSVEALSAYWNRVAVGYGLSGAAAQFSLADGFAPDGVKALNTLADLKNWIKNNGEG